MSRTSTNTYEIRVRSYELDPYNHVNNGTYVNWYEDAREQFLRTQDRTWMWYPDNLSRLFVIVRIDCEYLSSVDAGDRVETTTRLARIGEKSVVFRQLIRRADDRRLRSRARVVMAFSDGTRGAAVPEDFRERFEVSPEGDAWTDDEGGERG